jgi:hypothetical protein
VNIAMKVIARTTPEAIIPLVRDMVSIAGSLVRRADSAPVNQSKQALLPLRFPDANENQLHAVKHVGSRKARPRIGFGKHRHCYVLHTMVRRADAAA